MADRTAEVAKARKDAPIERAPKPASDPWTKYGTAKKAQ